MIRVQPPFSRRHLYFMHSPRRCPASHAEAGASISSPSPPGETVNSQPSPFVGPVDPAPSPRSSSAPSGALHPPASPGAPMGVLRCRPSSPLDPRSLDACGGGVAVPPEEPSVPYLAVVLPHPPAIVISPPRHWPSWDAWREARPGRSPGCPLEPRRRPISPRASRRQVGWPRGRAPGSPAPASLPDSPPRRPRRGPDTTTRRPTDEPTRPTRLTRRQTPF